MLFEIDTKELVEAIKELKVEMAQEYVDHVKDKIKNGVGPALETPREDGSTNTPLFHTGTHLYPSITYRVDDKGFDVGSTFVGAKRLHSKRPFLLPDEAIINKWFEIWKSRSK